MGTAPWLGVHGVDPALGAFSSHSSGRGVAADHLEFIIEFWEVLKGCDNS